MTAKASPGRRSIGYAPGAPSITGEPHRRAEEDIFDLAEKQAHVWLAKGFLSKPEQAILLDFLRELEATALRLEPVD